MIRVAFTFLAILLGAVLVASAGASAKDLTIDAFYGKFSGGGVAENADSLYFAVTSRDFDVQIRPQGNGFKIDWTSIIRRGGDPNNPNVRRKTQNIIFKNTPQSGVFRGAGSGDLLRGEPYIWARITDQTMTVYIMKIGESGGYNMQSYARTLSAFGMDLVFKRIRDGEPVRQASAKLTKR